MPPIPATKPSWQLFHEAIRDVLPLTQIGWQMLSVLALAAGAGYLVDVATGSYPVFFIIFTVLGIPASILHALKTAREVLRKSKSQEPGVPS